MTKKPWVKGKQCPDCGMITEAPQGGEWQCEEAPHENPKECIRHLRELVRLATEALEQHNLL